MQLGQLLHLRRRGDAFVIRDCPVAWEGGHAWAFVLHGAHPGLMPHLVCARNWWRVPQVLILRLELFIGGL